MYEEKYTLGLDIGEASVGWAVVRLDKDNHPCRIVDLGSYVWSQQDYISDMKKLTTYAFDRRTKLGSARNLRRKKKRLLSSKKLLCEYGFINLLSKEKGEKPIYDIDQMICNNAFTNVYLLRKKALDMSLSDYELSYVLLFFMKHRGYNDLFKEISYRDKSGKEINDEEGGKVLSNCQRNTLKMQELNCRSIGEYILTSPEFRFDEVVSNDISNLKVRNTSGDYRFCFKRSDILSEIKLILETQKKYNAKITDGFISAYTDVFLSQYAYDESHRFNLANMIGKCTFEEEELRASKNSFFAEYFTVLHSVNNLKVIDKRGVGSFLTTEQKKKVISLALTQKEVKFSKVRSLLAIDKDYHFNSLKQKKAEEDFEKVEKKTTFISMPFYHTCIDASKFGLTPVSFPVDLDCDTVKIINRLADIYARTKTVDKLVSMIQSDSFLAEKSVSFCNISPRSGFVHLSEKALKNILPNLETGLLYHEACSKAGYDFTANALAQKSKFITKQMLSHALKDVTNPTVKHCIRNASSLINSVINKYGSPYNIHIELARDVSKTVESRREIQKIQKENEDKREKAVKTIKELGFEHVSRKMIEKYLLWVEQEELDIYTGKKLELRKVLTDDNHYHVDHIVPRSVTKGVDAYWDKVLTSVSENEKKATETVYSYITTKGMISWHEFCEKVHFMKNLPLLKKKLLLMETNDFADMQDLVPFSVDINNTSYSNKVVLSLLRQLITGRYLEDENSVSVLGTNGKITSMLRDKWYNIYVGKEAKDRSVLSHHAVDAVIIACCNNYAIQRMTELWKRLEKYPHAKEEVKKGFKMTLPYPEFYTELDMRIRDDKITEQLEQEYLAIGYSEEDLSLLHPFYTVRKPSKPRNSSLHKETIYACYEGKKEEYKGKLYKKVPLSIIFDKADEKGIQSVIWVDEGGNEHLLGYVPDSDPNVEQAVIENLKKFISLKKKWDDIKKECKSGHLSKAEKDDKQEQAKKLENEFKSLYIAYKKKKDGSKGNPIKSIKMICENTSDKRFAVRKGFAECSSISHLEAYLIEGKNFFVTRYEGEKSPCFVCNNAESDVSLKRLKPRFQIRKNDLLSIDGMFFYYNTNDNPRTQRYYFYPVNSNEQVSKTVSKCTVFRCNIDILGRVSSHGL